MFLTVHEPAFLLPHQLLSLELTGTNVEYNLGNPVTAISFMSLCKDPLLFKNSSDKQAAISKLDLILD